MNESRFFHAIFCLAPDSRESNLLELELNRYKVDPEFSTLFAAQYPTVHKMLNEMHKMLKKYQDR